MSLAKRASRRAPHSSNLGSDCFLIGATLDYAVSNRMLAAPHLLVTRVYIAQPYARIDASQNPCNSRDVMSVEKQYLGTLIDERS
ncbi:unnamed protein product [Ceratitis capitata]|uniref:(Mediterranean fruit fly) hypothetical protein n=1 Tax=Ceratitis capitata TaxID=7213 RepID=A0A811UWC4_CERCA|nr:unnamed protein product [Ceratitis capitata]